MMDFLLILLAFLVEVGLFVVAAVSRPVQYLYSSDYRQQLRMHWQYSPYMIFLHVFGKLALLMLLGSIAVFIGYIVLTPAEPVVGPSYLNKELIEDLFTDLAQ